MYNDQDSIFSIKKRDKCLQTVIGKTHCRKQTQNISFYFLHMSSRFLNAAREKLKEKILSCEIKLNLTGKQQQEGQRD